MVLTYLKNLLIRLFRRIETVEAELVRPSEVLSYQIWPHEYYVKDFFLAKSLMYVLRYMNDDEAVLQDAVLRAAEQYKVDKDLILEHIHKIKE